MRSCLAALASVLILRSAAALPEDHGPYTVETWDAGKVMVAGTEIRTKVLYGSNTDLAGALVIVMHGNFRTGQFHTVLAETLASRGFIVVLPDMPCGFNGCNHTANARQLSGLLSWATSTSTTPGSRIFGRLNHQRALVGHSYGGLGSYLGTARDPSVNVVVLLDPKDDARAAETESPPVTVPSMHLLAEVEGACNGGWNNAVFGKTSPPHLMLRVRGSAHCDVEEPSDGLCPGLCGSGDPTKSRIFRRYTVAMLECALGTSAEAANYLGGAAMADDQSAGTIDNVVAGGIEALPCRVAAPPLPDGGISAGDAGVGDGGGASSAGSGCQTGTPGQGLWAVVIGALAWLWRARVHARR